VIIKPHPGCRNVVTAIQDKITSMKLTEDQQFEQIDFLVQPFTIGEYENCSFIKCSFIGIDLGGSIFINCTFTDCDMSVVKVNQVVFRDTHFVGCKLIGILFDSCKEYGLGVSFNNCNIDNASFYGTKIKGLRFLKSSLKSVDFSNADLNTAVFDDCDLLHAKFDNSIVEKVDFTTSFNYAIDMDVNRVKKSKHSVQGAMGLLHKYDLIIKI
jgi:uncharacterized protein YjbI with pentapeptide repeats